MQRPYAEILFLVWRVFAASHQNGNICAPRTPTETKVRCSTTYNEPDNSL